MSRQPRSLVPPKGYHDCSRCSRRLPESAYEFNHRKKKLFKTCKDCRDKTAQQRGLSGIMQRPRDSDAPPSIYRGWMSRPPVIHEENHDDL